MKTILLMTTLIIVSCSSSQQQQNEMVSHSAVSQAVANIHSEVLKDLEGTITIENLKNELKVTANISGLPVNSKLGFHIHENGICEGPSYKTAGGHLNPYGKPHGRPEGNKRHMGDMGNLESNAEGIAKKVILLSKIGSDDLELSIGKAVIVHAKADDLKTKPSGGAGDRLACGLLRPLN